MPNATLRTQTSPTTRTTLALVATAGLALAAGHALAQSNPLHAPFGPTQSMSSLASTGKAWRIDGREDRGQTGSHVSAAGDVNGDGVGDVIFGGPRVDGGGLRDTGEAYVVFGAPGGPSTLGSVADLNGENGFVFRGGAADDLLGSVASAGDVNGDGIGDVIIGARYADPSGSRSGESYVVFGRRGGFPAVLGPADLDGTNGFRLSGMMFHDQSGGSVAGAGDLNGDGVDDVVIGANSVDGIVSNSGEAYVVFGSRDGFDPVLALADLNGDNGFRLSASGTDRYLGNDVAAAGDVNGDGVADIIIGARFSGPGGVGSAGTAYVLFGRAGGFPATVSTADLDGSNGFAMHGTNDTDLAGTAVASAGDLNGDGIDDVAVGAPYAGRRGEGIMEQGYAYVVFGKAGGFAPAIALGDLDGTDGFRMEGATHVSIAGSALAPAGDVNGDGFDDLLLGAPGTGYSYTYSYYGEEPGRGAAFVILGRDTGFDAVVDLDAVSADSVIRFDGLSESATARSVAGMADFNGDGHSDFLLGATAAAATAGDDAGSVFVVYGRYPAPCRADLDGDGELTLFDFLAFQNAFDAGDPIADFDDDGEFTLFDFLLFQTAYDIGCP